MHVLGGLLLELQEVVLLAHTVTYGADIASPLVQSSLKVLALPSDCIVYSLQFQDFVVLGLDVAVQAGELCFRGKWHSLVFLQHLLILPNNFLTLVLKTSQILIELGDPEVKTLHVGG